jgi:hypothetical protein
MGKIRDPVRFSAYFGIPPSVLSAAGAFDPILNADTRLFIDPLLLGKSSHPEMIAASEDWHDYFRRIIKLIGASSQKNDLMWRAAAQLIGTGEFKGTCLGYGSGTIDGRGIGPSLTAQIMATAKTIVEMGVKDPEFFSLLPLFEEDVGSDLISDQTALIIAAHLAVFTANTLTDVSVDTIAFDFGETQFHLPVNPFVTEKGRALPIILVPQDVLATLPVAYGPEDIDTVVSHNRALRGRVNRRLGKSWAQLSKGEIKRFVLSSKTAFSKFLEANKEKRPAPYSITADPDGQVQWLEEGRRIADQSPIALALATNDLSGMRAVIEAILNQFKHLIEDKASWKVLYGQDHQPLPEIHAQKLFYAVADSYCKANNIDITPEANSGPGPVDFKFSHGYDTRIVVEIKLTTNSKLLQGYTKQLDKYKKAERTDAGYYLVLDFGGAGRQLENVLGLESRAANAGETHSVVHVVDARRQLSASNL